MNTIYRKTILVPRLVIIFLLALLIALYVNGLLKLDDAAHFGISALYFLAVGRLIADKQRELNYQSSPLSLVLSSVILGTVLSLAWITSNPNIFWRIMPLISAFGLIALVSKFNVAFFWRELVILFFLGIPRILIGAFYDPSPLTARAAALVLWYLGFDSKIVNDDIVLLPTGGVKVFEGCSGLEAMCYTLGLAVVLMLIYPVANRILQFSLPFIAILIGFTVNLMRVVLLALLNSWNYKSAFVYWHEGQGSLIFGMIAVMVLGTFHYFLPQSKA